MAAACHNSFAAVDAIASEPADARLLRPHAFKNRSLRGRAPSTTQFYSARDTRGWDRPECVAGNRSSTALWGGGSPGATSSPSWRDSRGARTRRSFHGRTGRAVCHAACSRAPRATPRVPSDRLAAEWVPPPPLKLFASASDHEEQRAARAAAAQPRYRNEAWLSGKPGMARRGGGNLQSPSGLGRPDDGGVPRRRQA